MATVDHDWFHPINKVGKYAGKPMKQRQCSRCLIWETPVSRESACDPGARSPGGTP